MVDPKAHNESLVYYKFTIGSSKPRSKPENKKIHKQIEQTLNKFLI